MRKDSLNDLPLPLLGEDWFDPLEEAVRQSIRGFIEAMLEGELECALGRGHYQRAGRATGYRNGHRERRLLGTFGPVTLSVPRARLFDAQGGDQEWRNQTLPAFKRRTKRAEAVIAKRKAFLKKWRLHEEFKRRIKTQCVLPTAETAAMLFWALLACGQITMRRVDG